MDKHADLCSTNGTQQAHSQEVPEGAGNVAIISWPAMYVDKAFVDLFVLYKSRMRLQISFW